MDNIRLKMIHLDWIVIICLRELRIPTDSLDLPNGADHLTVGEAGDRVEGLMEQILASKIQALLRLTLTSSTLLDMLLKIL